MLHCGGAGEFPDPANPAHHPAPPKKPRTDPSSLVNVGCVIDLRVVAEGDGLTYQWRKGNTNIPGANSDQLFIPVTSLNDAGSYRCLVTNGEGQSVLTKPIHMATLNVESSDHFVAAAPTASVSFSANYEFPTRTGLFEFQWYRMLGASPDTNTDEMLSDGDAYSGARKATLKVKVTNTDVVGSYYCVVIAYKTSMRTGLRNLAVVPAPAPTLVQINQPMEFSVTPVGPAHVLTGLTYQWLKGGGELPGEDASSYEVASATAGDAGQYSVQVTHPTLGMVTTPEAAAVIVDPPVSHVLVLPGKTASLVAPDAIATGQTFQWFRNDLPLADNAKFSGVTKNKLSVKKAHVEDGGEYVCRGTLYGDTVVIARQVLIVIPAPESQVVALGDSMQLLAEPAYGFSDEVNPALFSYQWVKGSRTSAQDIPGAQEDALDIESVTAGDFGVYSYRISYNGGTAVTSPLGNVAVVDTTPLSFDVNAGKSAKIGPVVHALRGVRYAWSFEETPLADGLKYAGVAKSRLSVLATTVDDAGTYQCEVSYPNGSSVTAEIDLVVYSAPEILDLEFPPAIVGGAYEYQIETSDDPLFVPDAYGAKPLPKGLSIDPLTGLISGTPTVSGDFDVVVSVKNAVGTTLQTATLSVAPLPEHLLGSFTGPLPRMLAGEFGEIGGRFDMTVASTGAASVSVLVGTEKFSGKGFIEVSDTNPSIAVGNADITLPRAAGDLTVQLTLNTNNRFTGEITGADSPVAFSGWRKVFSPTAPATDYAGRYNIALFPAMLPPPDVPLSPAPRGVGYASFTISDGSDGSYLIVGKTADHESITTAGFIGPDGDLLLYRTLYKTVQKGSILSTVSFRIDQSLEGNPVVGHVSWSRPANPASGWRRYKDGFEPQLLPVGGGLYTDPGQLLGAAQGSLTFVDAGVELASFDPDAVFNIPAGSGLPTITAPNDALTVFKASVPATGLFNGQFSLEDDDDTTPVEEADEYKRKAKFYGQVVTIDGEQVGVGYFLLFQLPTEDPPTTTANSPELSGSVQFEPVVD